MTTTLFKTDTEGLVEPITGSRWDLVVVGGGYWGSAIARAGRKRGWTTMVIDDGDEEGASRNSAGYVRWEYLTGRLASILPPWWGEDSQAASIAHVAELGASSLAEAVHNYRTDSWSEVPGLLLVNPWEVLMRDLTARVRLVNRTPAGWQVLTNQSDIIPAHRVVIAAGVWTDALLQASGLEELGVDQLVGSAILADGDIGPMVETYITRPYHEVTARRWQGGRVRVGETVSKTYPDAHLGTLISEASRLWPHLRSYQPIMGRRPVLPVATVKELGDGLVVAVGGHRIGLALAGGIAQKVAEVLS